jgi:2'-5' RNA ligase
VNDEAEPIAARRVLFTSFDEAWRSFDAGGQLTPMTEWRQRLTAGRAQFLSFQVPLAETAIADSVEELQAALGDIDGLAMFEREMLHISLSGVGFQVIAKKRPDDVTREEVGRITKRAMSLLRGARPVAIEVGPLNVFHDALILEVHDDGELGGLRRRLAGAAGDSFGIGDTQYLPHVTIAMFSDPAAAAPALRARLPSLRQRPQAAATVKRIELARWWFTGAETDFPERDPIRAYTLR